MTNKKKKPGRASWKKPQAAPAQGTARPAAPAATDLQALLVDGATRHKNGDLAGAERQYRAVLEKSPDHFDALHLLGTARAQAGKPGEAVELISRAIRIRPRVAEAHNNLGYALKALNRRAEAIDCYRRALALKPDYPDAHRNLGKVLLEVKRPQEAVAHFEKALALRPGAAAHCDLGRALTSAGRAPQALECYRNAIAADPGHVGGHIGMGDVHYAAGRYHEAFACFSKAAALKPDAAEAHFGMGNALLDLRRTEEALAAYDKALAIRKDYPEALNNRGNALLALNRTQEAAEAYRRAAAARPRFVEAHYHLGNALRALGRHDEAAASYEAALGIDPGFRYGVGMVANCQAYACDWRKREQLERRILQGVKAGKPVCMPLPLLALADDPADQLACAKIYAHDQHPAAELSWRGERYRHERPRVAYLSADFRDHPVAWLIAELIERHDRGKFETLGVSFGPPRAGPMRERLQAAFEHFVDVHAKTDAEVAELLRRWEVDIAIDLMGYTQGSRPGIFALRPAPVQVNYLGFPGTTGAPFMDYILGDRFVIPEAQQPNYSEKVVWLPDTFQANDTKRRISERTPTRAECGLPERGFVFCCFNNTYKLTPEFFDIWMRLLKRVVGSVLWLVTGDEVATANLRREAQARGVARERLVISSRVKPEHYLARYRVADLFLDTLPFNAGTTASDALWAGLPVLTCAGGAFASRMAGSLLHAIGLPELVTHSLGDYEALAVRLAKHPEELRAIRERLAANRGTAPLFDADRFRCHIESAYRTMWEVHQRGEPPRSFTVQPVAAVPGAREHVRGAGPDARALMADAIARHNRGDLHGAEQGYRAVLEQAPDHFDALHLLGAAHAQAGKPLEAVEMISRALQAKPDVAEAHNNLGFALKALNRAAEAVESYRRAIALKPDYIEARTNCGNTLVSLGRFEEAIECFREVVAVRPSARAHCSLGSALRSAGRHADALQCYRDALAIDPRDATACNHLGNTLLALNRAADAVAAYRKALFIKPDYTSAQNNLGIALIELNRGEEAVEAFRAAIAARPGYVQAHNHLGNALQIMGRHDEAVACYEAALAIQPRYRYAPGMLLLAAAHLCDWRRRADLVKRLVEGVSSGEPVVTPFVLLGAVDDPAAQLANAAAYSRHHSPAASASWRGERYRHERIRIAYVSADFRDHPVAWLIAELIERHDRRQFEVLGMSLGPEAPGAMRERMMKGFDRFTEVGAKSNAEIAELLRRWEVDIAIDLMGHTQGSRPGIFALRPAPVQVNYLGFPGTTGAPFMDYILGDRFVIPEAQQPNYSEKVVWLPDTFQANDTKRRISERTPTRAECGLPERGFVFCCFNNTYKLTPEFFDIWMRLLKRVEGSVLWVVQRNPATAINLQREAQARDVDPRRLVFASRVVDPGDYLARYRVADLFLDTLPYNAHTTASDALWAGLPVLTCAGTAFAGRAAGSLLHAIGLPELVTSTTADYEGLALRLAIQPQALRELRNRLEANRLTTPLFDIDCFRRHVESAYRTMWEMHQRGEAPRPFSVERAG